MAENSIVEATRLLLQSSAKVYYRGLSEDAKAEVRQSFFEADTRGEGRIPFHEFFDSAKADAPPGFSWKALFGFLDANNNGFLELDEFITLFYMTEFGVFFCNACSLPLVTGAFSCTQCPPPGPDSFDVCLSCYASPMPAFSHHHPRTSFVSLVARYHQSDSKNTFNSLDSQCDCCGTCEKCRRGNCSQASAAQQDVQLANCGPRRKRGFTRLLCSSIDLIAQLVDLSVQAGLFNG